MRNTVSSNLPTPQNPRPLAVPQPSAYQRWYSRNKEEFNKRRRERYRTDPSIKARLSELQREARANKPPNKKARIEFIGSSKVAVYRVGEVTKRVGVAIVTIRKWEREGLLPPPAFVSRHRYYTNNQISLIKEFYELAIEMKYKREEEREDVLLKKSKEIYAHWLDVKY